VNTILIVTVARKYLNYDTCEEARSPAAVTVWLAVSLFSFQNYLYQWFRNLVGLLVLGSFRQGKTGIFSISAFSE